MTKVYFPKISHHFYTNIKNKKKIFFQKNRKNHMLVKSKNITCWNCKKKKKKKKKINHVTCVYSAFIEMSFKILMGRIWTQYHHWDVMVLFYPWLLNLNKSLLAGLVGNYNEKFNGKHAFRILSNIYDGAFFKNSNS